MSFSLRSNHGGNDGVAAVRNRRWVGPRVGVFSQTLSALIEGLKAEGFRRKAKESKKRLALSLCAQITPETMMLPSISWFEEHLFHHTSLGSLMAYSSIYFIMRNPSCSTIAYGNHFFSWHIFAWTPQVAEGISGNFMIFSDAIVNKTSNLLFFGAYLHLLGFIDVPIIGSGSPLSDNLMDLYEKSCDTFALQYDDFVAHKKTMLFHLLLIVSRFIAHKDLKTPFLMHGCKVADDYGIMLVIAVGINIEWGLLIANISFFTGHTKNFDGSVQFVKGHTSVKDAVDGAVKILTVAVTIMVVAVPKGLPLAVTLIISNATLRLEVLHRLRSFERVPKRTFLDFFSSLIGSQASRLGDRQPHPKALSGQEIYLTRAVQALQSKLQVQVKAPMQVSSAHALLRRKKATVQDVLDAAAAIQGISEEESYCPSLSGRCRCCPSRSGSLQTTIWELPKVPLTTTSSPKLEEEEEAFHLFLETVEKNYRSFFVPKMRRGGKDLCKLGKVDGRLALESSANPSSPVDISWFAFRIVISTLSASTEVYFRDISWFAFRIVISTLSASTEVYFRDISWFAFRIVISTLSASTEVYFRDISWFAFRIVISTLSASTEVYFRDISWFAFRIVISTLSASTEVYFRDISWFAFRIVISTLSASTEVYFRDISWFAFRIVISTLSASTEVYFRDISWFAFRIVISTLSASTEVYFRGQSVEADKIGAAHLDLSVEGLKFTTSLYIYIIVISTFSASTEVYFREVANKKLNFLVSDEQGQQRNTYYNTSAKQDQCMADPDLDFGISYDEQGFIHILHSTFFNVDSEIDHTIKGYVEHILDTLTEAIEEQLGNVQWHIVSGSQQGFPSIILLSKSEPNLPQAPPSLPATLPLPSPT
ncbi:hypothetical protein IEQ34_001861 [Dendrobium chrysotoxum]|uniref:Uncharacterized protein n=1 Tax=Dendrobium chrysotoxum TaxID=161865 RepID=A0AAV7H4D6_DENCH|nr:hypothetical protein IEQ34_001861 [Dendrobium chrysotoxum]